MRVVWAVSDSVERMRRGGEAFRGFPVVTYIVFLRITNR